MDRSIAVSSLLIKLRSFSGSCAADAAVDGDWFFVVSAEGYSSYMKKTHTCSELGRLLRASPLSVKDKHFFKILWRLLIKPGSSRESLAVSLILTSHTAPSGNKPR